jgi:hypothetical protein
MCAPMPLCVTTCGGLEGIVSKRLGSRYRSGRTTDWLKFKNPEAPAVKREAEEVLFFPSKSFYLYGAVIKRTFHERI